MKRLLRAFLVATLNVLSRRILAKYKPEIIMITGSVGKTSTKDAVAAALSGKFYLRASEKSFNSELGVPLTVIGVTTPWANPSAWIKVLLEGMYLVVFPSHYPKLLVLEVGADRPGDITNILRIATPTAVVVTRLPEVPVHVEVYESPAQVRQEEFAPAYTLPHGAPLIISADDEYVVALTSGVHASIGSYGYSSGAGVHITDAEFTHKEDEVGMRANLEIEGKTYPISAKGVLGRQQLYAPAAAVAIARALGISISDALKGLKGYVPPPGRARVLFGKHDSILIDDTYNASPAAVEEALSSFSLMKGAKRRIAVLGDMLELGRYSVGEHERMGRLVAETADILVTVGVRAESMREAALQSGMEEGSVFSFASSSDASTVLLEMVRQGDVVLIKGSQGVRMERITETLLEDERDAALLTRQDREWKKR